MYFDFRMVEEQPPPSAALKNAYMLPSLYGNLHVIVHNDNKMIKIFYANQSICVSYKKCCLACRLSGNKYKIKGGTKYWHKQNREIL